MTSTVDRTKYPPFQQINNWLFFSLSDKMKFAIKASLSLVLVYLIAFSMGWEPARTAAITVLILATIGPNISSSKKALFRVVETLVGATVGLILIGLFPQDRLSYFLFVSIAVVVFTYLSRAHKGDMVLFMLSSLTLLMMFDSGEVDGVFLYGIDRVFMIIFGIVVFTLVDTLIWPVKVNENSIENALSLTSVEFELYRQRDAERTKRKELYQALLSKEALLDRSNLGTSDASGEMGFTTKQWHSIAYNYKKINEIIILLSYHDKMHYTDDLPRYVENYQKLDQEIVGLFEAVSIALKEQKEIDIPSVFEPDYQVRMTKELGHLDHATLIATIEGMQKLHAQLCKLSEKINSLISPKPTLFTLEDIPRTPIFLWWDIEDIKGTFITFLIFWTTALVWIYLNPPGTLSYGYDLVIYATAISVYTTYKPTNPSKMIILFSFSFVFATPMYIFVLPNLTYGWELALFIFGYGFIGFYFFKYTLSLFFMFGFVTLDIVNQMTYSFAIIAGFFFIIYSFLVVLLIFYYIPFSTKPEYIFLTLKKRFFRLSRILIHQSHKRSTGTKLIDRMAVKYSKIHLMSTVKKMQFWTGFIDEKYFKTVDKELLLNFTKESEEFVYLLKMMQHKDLQMIDNPLFKTYKSKYNEAMLADLLEGLALGEEERKADSIWSNEKYVIKHIEDNLEHILSGIKHGEYPRKDIIEFYENVNLRKNVWLSLFKIQKMILEIDFKALEMNRF